MKNCILIGFSNLKPFVDVAHTLTHAVHQIFSHKRFFIRKNRNLSCLSRFEMRLIFGGCSVGMWAWSCIDFRFPYAKNMIDTGCNFCYKCLLIDFLIRDLCFDKKVRYLFKVLCKMIKFRNWFFFKSTSPIIQRHMYGDIQGSWGYAYESWYPCFCQNHDIR